MVEYIVRRCLYIIPLLILISVLAFIIIKLPPGDFLSTYIMSLRRSGAEVNESVIANLENRYGLNQPTYVQYFKWVSGFFHGDFGRSFQFEEPVKNIISDRIGFTMVIACLTLLFQWIFAIPIGIYSAVRQYSIFDYFWTFVGFIGLSVPNFLLALILMFVGIKYFGASIGGLFSSEFIGQPWTWPKFFDLLQHIWVPVVVIGTAGMAGQIRIMRGQMLDEIGKQYIQTARAKGLSEWIVIMKHATRVAVNPIISTAGWMLPRIVSGATIAGIVLGLPTIGPTLFGALTSQDMYLAGTIVMLQSTLVVIGTLLSDILLSAIDPRIRYE